MASSDRRYTCDKATKVNYLLRLSPLCLFWEWAQQVFLGGEQQGYSEGVGRCRDSLRLGTARRETLALGPAYSGIGQCEVFPAGILCIKGCAGISTLHIVGILCVWALQGCSARIPCGWVLGYPVVDACREFLQFNTTLRLGVI